MMQKDYSFKRSVYS